jgi:hypothetical protein
LTMAAFPPGWVTKEEAIAAALIARPDLTEGQAWSCVEGFFPDAAPKHLGEVLWGAFRIDLDPSALRRLRIEAQARVASTRDRPSEPEIADTPDGVQNRPGQDSAPAHPPERPSARSEIQAAARKLGKTSKEFPRFEDYRRALCDLARVDYDTRGWSEDSVRRATQAQVPHQPH